MIILIFTSYHNADIGSAKRFLNEAKIFEEKNDFQNAAYALRQAADCFYRTSSSAMTIEDKELFRSLTKFYRNKAVNLLNGTESQLYSPVSQDGEKAKLPQIDKIEKVYFKDLGGLDEIIKVLKEYVMYPIKYPKQASEYDIKPPKGIILLGPPGTGKTMLAKAMGTELGFNVLQRDGAEFRRSYVGEGEEAVRNLFKSAELNNPCLILIDEIEAILPDKSVIRESHENSLLNQFLSCMDGFRSLENVVVVGTTNYINRMDRSVLRSERFTLKFYLSLPNENARYKILQLYTNIKNNGKVKRRLDSNVNLQSIASITENYSGADLKVLCEISARFAWARSRESKNTEPLTMEDFKKSLQIIKPILTKDDLQEYEAQKRFATFQSF